MLEETAALERSRVCVRPVPARLVVDDLVTAIFQPVDPVDPSAQGEAKAGTQVDHHGLGLRQGLALGGSDAEGDLEANRPAPLCGRLETEEKVEVAEQLLPFAAEDIGRGRRD